MALYNVYKKQHEKEYGKKPQMKYIGYTWDYINLWDGQEQNTAKIYDTAYYNTNGKIYEVNLENEVFEVVDKKAYLKWQPPIPYTIW